MIKGITPEKLKNRQNSICKSKVLTMYIFEVLLMLTPELAKGQLISKAD